MDRGNDDSTQREEIRIASTAPFNVRQVNMVDEPTRDNNR